MHVTFSFPEGKKRVMTFSYDDGNLCDQRLADIFTSTGMKCTFNINSGFMERDTKLKANALKALIANGHEIACHGMLHPFEEQLPASVTLEDVLEDKRKLEEATGTIIRGMAYPYGTYSKAVTDILRVAGIEYSRTTAANKRVFYFPESNQWQEWHPTCHHRDDLDALTESFMRPYPALRMFYIWGHAYEFDRDNNWERIEQFCDKMKNNSEIWYATNIEIHDYVEACRSIKTSADSRMLYNPTAIPVFVCAEEKTYVVEPGKTLKI